MQSTTKSAETPVKADMSISVSTKSSKHTTPRSIVVWDNPNELLHFVVIENAEDDQETLFPDFGGKFGSSGGRGSFQRISAPTRESSHEINFTEIQYWGQYIVKVYRVNQEYADLYENLEQDSRDLNEPPTNIKNGLGIFSAFNSQNVYFRVEKESSTTTGW